MIINGNLVLFSDLLTSNGGYYLLRSWQSIGSQCCEWWSLRFIFLLHCSSSVRCSSWWFLNLGCTNCSILGLSAAIGGLDCDGRTRFFLSILLHPWVTHDFLIIDIVFVLKVSYRLMRLEQGLRFTFDLSGAATSYYRSSLIEGIFSIIPMISKINRHKLMRLQLKPLLTFVSESYPCWILQARPVQDLSLLRTHPIGSDRF